MAKWKTVGSLQCTKIASSLLEKGLQCFAIIPHSQLLFLTINISTFGVHFFGKSLDFLLKKVYNMQSITW